MAYWFDASTGAFYDDRIHGQMPAGVARITPARHRELLEAQSAGKRIVSAATGAPQIARMTLAGARAAKDAAAAVEAERRILAIASMARQSNDNALLALFAIDGGEWAPEHDAARARRIAIDAIRIALGALEARIDRLAGAALAALDPADPAHWPQD